MPDEQTPFADLPAVLVDEVLEKASNVGGVLSEDLRSLKEQRVHYRNILFEKSLVLHESSLGLVSSPTTCGVDGSYAVERLLTADVVVAASVAVEGLTPPSEKRYWENPHHSTFIEVEKHHSDTVSVLRAIMLGNELILSTRAPHDVVMIDGTMTLPIIYFNQALNQCEANSGSNCAREFIAHWADYFKAYRDILFASRTDKHYVALPKYSTRREVGRLLGWDGHQDDRGLLTLVLQPGELTKPVPLEQPDSEWHLTWRAVPDDQDLARQLESEIVAGLHRVYVFYYKPHPWLPALRVELSEEIVRNTYRLGTVVQALKHQCATPSMLEPYPLYLADRTVKAMARSVPTIRQVATQKVACVYDGDVSEVFLALHSYRSETGVS